MALANAEFIKPLEPDKKPPGTEMFDRRRPLEEKTRNGILKHVKDRADPAGQFDDGILFQRDVRGYDLREAKPNRHLCGSSTPG
jgi:hypothetical protein